MANYPSPCDKCTRKKCPEKDCIPWRIRYLYRQKQINAYAQKIGIEVGKQRRAEDGK